MSRSTLPLMGILAVVALPVWGDVIFEGQKKARCDTVIDFGPYADGATRCYQVEAGDTISALAEKHLGGVARQKEILDLNPGLAPETLRAGETILLPAREPDPAKGWDFFAVSWGDHVERAFHGEPLHHHHYWTDLWAVPREKTELFLKRLAVDRQQQREAIDALSKEPWVARADARLCGYAGLSDTSPVASVLDTFKIEKIELGRGDEKSGRIVLKKMSRKKFDKDRKLVAGLAPHLTAGNGLLLLFSTCGALGLGILALRRRTEKTLGYDGHVGSDDCS